MQCFEGAKAFKGTDGKVRLFRGRQNMFRLKNSCKSLSLPVNSQASQQTQFYLPFNMVFIL